MSEVDAVGLGQGLVKGVLADHLAQGGLGDLVDGRGHVLDRDHRLGRVDDLVVGDGGDVDADVVAGDDALGLDRHGHDPQRHPPQHLDQRHDQPQAGLSDPHHPAEAEQHPSLVLLDDPHRQRKPDQHQHRDHNDGQPTAHVCSLLARLPDRGDQPFLLWP